MSIDQKKKKKKLRICQKIKIPRIKISLIFASPTFFGGHLPTNDATINATMILKKKKQMKISSSSKKKNIYITTTNCYHYYLLLPTTYSNSFFFSVYMYLGAPRARFDVLHFDFGAFSTEFATDCQY